MIAMMVTTCMAVVAPGDLALPTAAHERGGARTPQREETGCTPLCFSSICMLNLLKVKEVSNCWQ